MYSSINITGLAIGIAACLLIILYVQDELSYDSSHANSNRIYRVIRQMSNGNELVKGANVNYVLQDLLTENFPQIESAVRITPLRKSLVKNEDASLEVIENAFYLAEPSLFRMFDFEWVNGDPATALNDPFSLVVTDVTAEKYFGNDNPIGQVLTLNNDKTFKVTGVIKPLPANSHFHCDFIGSLSSTKGWYNPIMFEHWGNIWLYSYLLLREGTDHMDLERQFVQMLDTHGPPALKQFGVSFSLQPLERIHLYSNIQGELEANGSATFVFVFAAVAILILLIACFNFINLATARSAWRAKEVGIRKVVGAQRQHLVFQFLGESLFLTLIATIISVGIIVFLLPYFNQFAGKELSIGLVESATLWVGLLGIMILVGITSGSFPAFLLSGFKPIQVLKGKSVGDQRIASGMRKTLVVFQFSISIILIIGTLVVYKQLQFVKNKDLGFKGEQVMVIPLNSKAAKQKVDVLKSSFASNSNIRNVSAASDVPPSRLNSWRFMQKGAPEDSEQLVEIIGVDYEYLDLLDVEMVDGRKFSREFTTDETEALIINEAAVSHLGLNTPLGTRFDGMGIKEFNVIGVVKDFHFASLRDEIKPLMIHIWPSWYANILVKIEPDYLSETIGKMEAQWNASVPDWAFEYYFLDEEFDKLYRSEERLGQLVTYFSALAIFIASLGLFGLASFMAEQKIKEIGIRKVLGASIASIVWMQFRVFLSLIAVALIISIPVGLYYLDMWLQDFAYRIELNWVFFVVAGGLATLIALVTVSYQSIKAAIVNPVKSLRYE